MMRGVALWLGNQLDRFSHILLLPRPENSFNRRLLAAFNTKKETLDGRAIVLHEGADELVALYSTYEFTDKLIIGSLDLPPGRKLRNLLDCGIATEDELIELLLMDME